MAMYNIVVNKTDLQDSLVTTCHVDIVDKLLEETISGREKNTQAWCHIGRPGMWRGTTNIEVTM